MSSQSIYQLISEINKLKWVFRNTTTDSGRKESTAEHSWSASMIVIILMDELRKEFGDIDELKTIKMALFHDIVEIYAGDVTAFDPVARKHKEEVEREAMQKLMAIDTNFGKQLHAIWHEFEEKKSIEAKIAKAADSICPIFLRTQSRQNYFQFNVTVEDLDRTKLPHIEFSKTFKELYVRLRSEMIEQELIKVR